MNLEKISSDIRLLASDLLEKKELELPKKQLGSSIMPSKINPVIVEFIVAIAHKVYSNDLVISSLSAQGVLELNANLPITGHCVLESIELLISATMTMRENLFTGLKINEKNAKKTFQQSYNYDCPGTFYWLQ